MNKIATLSIAALLAAGLSQASLAQGKGHDKGGGPDKHADQGPGKGKGGDNRGNGEGKGKGHGQGGPDVVHIQGDGGDHPGKGRKSERVIVRQAERGAVRVERVEGRLPQVDSRVIIVNRYGERGLIAGCPPGLAKKHNGCMPPGQERKLARERYYSLWGRPIDSYNYRYDDGYLYRYDRQGGLLGYLPALGGILSVGNPWPDQYRYDPMPSYYNRYYGLSDPYDYRYADGAIYGVDPQTQAIRQVVALMTGQPISVGQRMPVGYDVYNVPYPYRTQYYDSPDRYYRYNDGYVYQVDPTTQLVQAIIQLLV